MPVDDGKGYLATISKAPQGKTMSMAEKLLEASARRLGANDVCTFGFGSSNRSC